MSNTPLKTILAIDDNGIILRKIKTMLQGEYEVIIATDGVSGIRKAIEKKPSVILLDYEMPDMNGKEAFEKILANEEIKHIPVIFLTAVSDRKRVSEVLGKLPAAYVLKPLDKDKLVERIENTLMMASLTSIDDISLEIDDDIQSDDSDSSSFDFGFDFDDDFSNFGEN